MPRYVLYQRDDCHLCDLALAVLAGCKRNESGQLPEASGEPIKAQATKVEGFALVGAYPDQHDGDLAIALEFSRTVVSSQDFDAVLVVKGANGAVVKGSWVLDRICCSTKLERTLETPSMRVRVPSKSC